MDFCHKCFSASHITRYGSRQWTISFSDSKEKKVKTLVHVGPMNGTHTHTHWLPQAARLPSPRHTDQTSLTQRPAARCSGVAETSHRRKVDSCGMPRRPLITLPSWSLVLQALLAACAPIVAESRSSAGCTRFEVVSATIRWRLCWRVDEQVT